MSDPDLERRLARLVPVEPRPGLRDDVLRDLAAARPGRLRRFVWAAAAAILLALVGVQGWMESAHEIRLARLLGDAPPTRRERRALAVEEHLASLLSDPALRRRIRHHLTVRRVPKNPAFSIPGGSRNG